MPKAPEALPRRCPGSEQAVIRVNLTDRFIRSRKPAAAGRRVDYPDGIVPGLALRVTDRGHKSFVLIARYPANPRNPTRRALGDYGALTLDAARAKARAWLELISRGLDPRVEAEREAAAGRRPQLVTFARVAEAFLERHMKPLAKYASAKAVIGREFTERWRDRPAAEISTEEAAAAIRAIVERGTPALARNAHGYLSSLYSWAIGTGEFGLATSPLAPLRPASLIGAKVVRQRILADDELRDVWHAAGELGYPYGPLIRLLVLTGQRKNEIAEASWPELQPAGWRAPRRRPEAALVIPAARMKADSAHLVPLVPAALAILLELPEFASGPYIFTSTAGVKPVNGFSKAKLRLDAAIARRRAARRAGAAAAVDQRDQLTPWVLHDLRRTMRTHLSALPIEDLVRELVIAHARPGLHKVYDLHKYEAEKRHALRLWAARLLKIVAG